jgi:nucleoid-associated protein YgaU
VEAVVDPIVEPVEDPVVDSIEPEKPDVGPEGPYKDGVYVVEKGDTLAIISRKVYGDLDHIDAICRMNGLKNGNLILVGQKLLLP